MLPSFKSSTSCYHFSNLRPHATLFQIFDLVLPFFNIFDLMLPLIHIFDLMLPLFHIFDLMPLFCSNLRPRATSSFEILDLSRPLYLRPPATSSCLMTQEINFQTIRSVENRAIQHSNIDQRYCRSVGHYNRSNSKTAHAGSRTRVTSMGGLYDAATLHVLMPSDSSLLYPFICDI